MELLPADSEERLAKARKVWETIEAKSRHIEAQLRDLDNVGGNDNEDAYSDLSAPFSDMGDVGFTKTASNKVSGWLLISLGFKKIELCFHSDVEQISIGYNA